MDGRKDFNRFFPSEKEEKKIRSSTLNPKIFCFWCGLSLVIAAAVTAAFWSSLDNGFTNWDDDKLVVDNELIREISLENLIAAGRSSYASAQGPIPYLSLALDHALGGLDPFVFHRMALVLHVANSLILFLLLHRLGLARIGAFFGAMLFGLHPLHVESVAWISERKDLLCAFFFFCALYFYQGYAHRKSGGRYALCAAALLLALASKSMAISLPLVFLVQDYLARRRWSVGLLVEKVPFFAAAAAIGLVTWFAQTGSMAREGALDPASNILIAIRGLAFYLAKLAVPTSLSAFYPYPETISLAEPQFALALGAVILSGIAVYLSRRRSRLAVFGALFFAITLLPVLKIIPVGNAAAADRYTYIPSAGIFLIAGVLAAWLWQRATALKVPVAGRGALCLAGFGIVAALGSASFERCKVWHDSETLWRDVIAKYPDLPVAHYNLGLALRAAGETDGALASYREAIRLDPRDAQAHNNIADILIEGKDFDEAWIHCRHALNLDPGIWQAHMNAAIIFGARGDYEGALEAALQALRLNQRSADSAYLAGLSLYHLGRGDEGTPYLEKAVALRPALEKAVTELERRFE